MLAAQGKDMMLYSNNIDVSISESRADLSSHNIRFSFISMQSVPSSMRMCMFAGRVHSLFFQGIFQAHSCRSKCMYFFLTHWNVSTIFGQVVIVLTCAACFLNCIVIICPFE